MNTLLSPMSYDYVGGVSATSYIGYTQACLYEWNVKECSL